MKTVSRLGVAALLALGGAATHAATLLVPTQYPTIQSAVDAAAVAGDVVLVSPGTYAENVIISKKTLDIESTDGPDTTVIDGGHRGAGVSISVFNTDRVRIAGFTVQNGTGGGIAASGNAIVDNCLIENNWGNGGGGVSFNGNGVSELRHSRVLHNHAGSSGDSGGGGVYVGYGTKTRIIGNTIRSNTSGYVGGGLLIRNADTVIERNVISDNDSGFYTGGGLEIWPSDTGAPVIANNLIIDNQGGDLGGGIDLIANNAGATVVNNTIVGNIVYSEEGEDVYGAQLALGGIGAKRVIVANNIFSGDRASSVYCTGRHDWQSAKFFHNDVYGGAQGSCYRTATTGTNVTVKPQFVEGADAHPYHLPPDSPLIDIGSNRHARGLGRDLDYLPRIVDGGHGRKVDIGAFEYQPQ